MKKQIIIDRNDPKSLDKFTALAEEGIGCAMINADFRHDFTTLSVLASDHGMRIARADATTFHFVPKGRQA